MRCPFMYPHWSEAGNAQSDSSSSGCPSRPAGTADKNRCRTNSTSSPDCRARSWPFIEAIGVEQARQQGVERNVREIPALRPALHQRPARPTQGGRQGVVGSRFGQSPRHDGYEPAEAPRLHPRHESLHQGQQRHALRLKSTRNSPTSSDPGGNRRGQPATCTTMSGIALADCSAIMSATRRHR